MGPIVVLEVPGIPWRRNTSSLQGRTVRGEGVEHVDGACRGRGRSRHCVGVGDAHPYVGGCYTTSPPDNHTVVDKKIQIVRSYISL